MSDNKTIGQVDGGGLAKKKMIVEIGAEAASWTVDDVKSRLAETGLEVQRTFGTPATQFTVSAIGLEESFAAAGKLAFVKSMRQPGTAAATASSQLATLA